MIACVINMYVLVFLALLFTGDTPRRSERISKRAKAFEIVEEVPKKKGKRSITKGRSVEKKKNLDEKTEEVREETGAMEEKKALDEKTEQVQEETGAMEENKESVDSEMKDAADDKIGKEEPITDETIMKDSAENDNEATKETIMVEATKPVEDVDNNNTNGQEKADEDMKEHIVEQNEAPAIDNDKVEDEKTDLKIEENTHVKKAEDKKLTDAEETIHKEKAEDKKLIDAEETIHEEKAEDKVVTHIEEKTQEEKSEDKVVTHTEEKTQEEKVEDKVVTNTEEKILEEKAKEVISADRDCKEEAKVDQNPHTATMDSPHADAEKADKKPNSSDNPIDSGVHSINRDEVAAQHKASPIQC